MKENVIQDKSYKFALRIIKVYRYLTEEKREYVLSKQLMRSGTSIGANVEEAIGGQSRKDFLHKLSIAYKEARETRYWIRLARDSDFLTEDDCITLLEDCEELLKLLGSIIRSVKIKN